MLEIGPGGVYKGIPEIELKNTWYVLGTYESQYFNF